MLRLDEARHIRTALGNLSAGGRLELVARLRDVAIQTLRPVAAAVPRPIPDRLAPMYRAKGLSLEWDLLTTDAFEFAHATRSVDLTPSQKSAVALLYECTRALDDAAVTGQQQQAIVDAYAGLDLDAVGVGEKFTQGRKPGAVGVIRKAVAKLLGKSPTMKNAALWQAIAAKPPKGWEFFNNSLGIYADGPDGKTIGYGRFQNVCAEERKKLKS